ncbi:MAG: proline dehydrogenase family protein, partial [Chloroflexota bacterium]|nr:proline dehydrogenase family protein [Chloroflexota bacterium]
RGAELDDRYLRLVTVLLDRHHPVSIATHDPELLARILPLVDPVDATGTVEFEMLRGVGEGLLGHIHETGYRTRLYLPFGVEWYLYLCHRQAEYPPNLYRALSDALDRVKGPPANTEPANG